MASPTAVPVAWHSSSVTVDGSRSAAEYAARIASSWPRGEGERKPPVLPSLDRPMPRMMPSTVRPARTASRWRIRATNPAPSPGIMPSARRSKGRGRPLRLSAPSEANPTWICGPAAALTAPASIRSAAPSCSRSQAILIAYSEEAHAASRPNPPAPRPSACAARAIGVPEQKRSEGCGRLPAAGADQPFGPPRPSRSSHTCSA
jgi:hypothetical protein